LQRGETEELLKPQSLRKLRDVIMNFQIAGTSPSQPHNCCSERCIPHNAPLAVSRMSVSFLTGILSCGGCEPGRDTVAQALSWSMYLLCTHPDVQEKVFQEASTVIGDTPIGKVRGN
jgi:hypothetical protein